MSCAFTICNDCGAFMNHQLVYKCLQCGSENVERECESEP
jgi:anaerobic ribonucleoside-triphosphate reductase